jgi:hypothetical protein
MLLELQKAGCAVVEARIDQPDKADQCIVLVDSTPQPCRRKYTYMAINSLRGWDSDHLTLDNFRTACNGQGLERSLGENVKADKPGNI